jgi:hypothetical protein
MNHTVVEQADAKARYDGTLEAPETYRRAKRLSRQDLGLRARILSIVGDALIVIIDWLPEGQPPGWERCSKEQMRRWMS